ncbi:MAG: hypothetical protein JHC95_11235 [Solirubrobacteraceae bacterium]|nr:hypothetical protein [Solirubrobacteraceae bacterium]
MISRADLDPLRRIAQGGFGIVYRTGFRLPGDARPLAYKEFTTDHAAQARAAAAAVDLWEGLDDADRKRLGRCAAWPRALVKQHGVVCGLLMPLLGDEYFMRNTRTGKRSPREMSWLIATQKVRAASGVDVPAVDLLDRLVLAAKLAYAIALLHRLQWVYGDLSFANAAFALGPPGIVLLDCDAAAPLADSSRTQSNTLGWDPPEVKNSPGSDPLQDDRSDVYKLGLAILRCLSPGMGAGTTRGVGRLRNELTGPGRDLVAAALSDDPADRPQAKDLYRHLADRVRSEVTPPVLHFADLLSRHRLRGQDVQIAFHVEGATEVEVHAGNGQRVVVVPSTGATTFAFRPDVSGPIALVARNRFGEVRAPVGDVELYELPSFEIGRVQLPRPDVPELSAVTLGASSTAVADRPLTIVGTSALSVPLPDVGSVVRDAAPLRSVVGDAPPLLDGIILHGSGIPVSVADGGAAIASILHDTAARASARLRSDPQPATTP